ncbi:CarD family transcriptional regulator [Paraclostridium tenue]|uniref:CarD family transcriptional regulator n=1 Tax=Paeniclostridium hominis TaxID=2764329 RepID=A0ABR7K2S7_9FIRM|nr:MULTISPECIES: CarD family transcriptional regulator [Paeniclostridium]MBC6003413.1 CarD family transcriptional regulator [Paeniclostridium hominis]
MYKIGEYIIYGNDGVCKVEDVGVLNISGINKKRIYYTLKPLYENGKIFTPIDTSVFMRSLINYEEVQQLIESIPYIKDKKCNEKNSRLLQIYYKNLLQTHECSDLLTLIAGIYEKKDKAMKNGKKLGQIDNRFMKVAEGLINDEFSVVLGIPREEVADYIKEKIKEYENK